MGLVISLLLVTTVIVAAMKFSPPLPRRPGFHLETLLKNAGAFIAGVEVMAEQGAPSVKVDMRYIDFLKKLRAGIVEAFNLGLPKLEKDLTALIVRFERVL